MCAASNSLFSPPSAVTDDTLDPVVLLEFHTLKKLFMLEFLETLKSKGYIAFLIENEFATISECIDNSKIFLEQRSELKSGLSILHKLAINEAEKRAISSLLSDNPNDLKPDEDPNIFSDDRWLKRIAALSGAERAKAVYFFNIAFKVRQALVNLAIYEKIKSLGFEYHAIDVPGHKMIVGKMLGDGAEYRIQTERNTHMADQLNMLSKKYNGGVIVLIGAFHFPIQNILAKKGWPYGSRSHWLLINPGTATILEPSTRDKFKLQLPKDVKRLQSSCAYGLHIVDSQAGAESYLKMLEKEEKKPSSSPSASS